MSASRRPKVLIVDDGSRYVEVAHLLLRDYDYATRCELATPCWECERRPGCQLTHAHDWSETVAALEKHPDVDVVLLDVVFDLPRERLLSREDGDEERSRLLQGIEILRSLRRKQGTLPVVLMTSRAELRFEDAAEALAADEFVTLAETDVFDARAIGLLVERILARAADTEDSTAFLWGASRKMARIKRDSAILAQTSLPLLLLGETGTGKSALAERVLHPLTGRSGPFVVADLAAIPSSLVAAELFGTVRGAFSGAVDRAGFIEQATGGTLFLDEIGNLPQEVQRMLLVTLQNSRLTRLGDTKPRKTDVKLIAATNVDLDAAVHAGAFRPDLYARLNPAARLKVPPLRDRAEDIVGLASTFVEGAFREGANRALLEAYMKTAKLTGSVRAFADFPGPSRRGEGIAFAFSKQIIGALGAHPFPGNVRELEMLMANASILALADALRAAESGRSPSGPAARLIPVPAKLFRELLLTPWLDRKTSSPAEGLVTLPITPAPGMREVMRQVEARLLENLFHETDGDFEAMAARLLTGDSRNNGRRVRLRFNQLGLKAKRLRRR